MSLVAATVLTAGGVLVILVGLWDMFHTLLHPTGQGRLSSWVLAGGRVVAAGTHDELIGRPGPYADLWAVQTGVLAD